MVRVRLLLIVLLAVLGLAFELGWTATAFACPLDTLVTKPVAHDDGCGHASQPAKPAPMSHDGQLCIAACVAVLPALPLIAPHVLPPVALFSAQPQALRGIDPALDPTPPRAA